MAHPEQAVFCTFVRDRFPEKFKGVSVLDIGSLDINGNNRYLFTDYTYTGIDVGPGKNVDIVSKGHEFKSEHQFDVVISTECFEHDQHWRLTLQNAVSLTKPGGLFMFTCATTGRHEHGTSRTTPQDAPLSHGIFNDYYHNLTSDEIEDAIDIPGEFSEWHFGTNDNTKDLYFYGIKRV
jgi:SAM-dependent methyltransferase